MEQPFAIGSYRNFHGIEKHIDSEATGDVIFRLLTTCDAVKIKAPPGLRTSLAANDSSRGHCQSSIDRPGTLANSEVLCETRIILFAKAIEAICRSFGPIGVPWLAK